MSVETGYTPPGAERSASIEAGERQPVVDEGRLARLVGRVGGYDRAQAVLASLIERKLQANEALQRQRERAAGIMRMTEDRARKFLDESSLGSALRTAKIMGLIANPHTGRLELRPQPIEEVENKGHYDL